MHIIDFKGRNRSGVDNINLLFNDKILYIMDNHLAASWCWAQKIDLGQKYNILHIDRHYDMLYRNIDFWLKELEKCHLDLKENTFQEVHACEYSSSNTIMKTIRYDNYIPIFLESYPDLIDGLYYATHKDGFLPDKYSIEQIEIYGLLDFIEDEVPSKQSKWIVNIDIDYFYIGRQDYVKFCSDNYIDKLIENIKSNLSRIEVLTIALSPQFCSGWENAEKIAKKIVQGLDFNWYE